MDNRTDIIDKTRFADLERKLDTIIPKFGKLEVYEISEVKKIVTKSLEAHKIKFEFNDETGNFTIPIVAGVKIIAEFGRDSVYDCQVRCNTDNLDDFEKKVGGFFTFSPEAIERYIPTFKAIISTTEDFLGKFIETQKKSKNIIDIAKREVTSLGLNGVLVSQLERYDYKSRENVFVEDTYTLTKEIMTGLRVGIRFTPEDYKSKCARFKEVIERIPKTFVVDDWRNIQCIFTLRVENDRFKTLGESWADASEKMNYVDIIEIENNISETSSIPDKVLNGLKEMGFIFSFRDNVLNIWLSADFTLCREAKKVYFKTSESASKKLPINDEEFITLLRIIAKASTRNGYLTLHDCGIVGYKRSPYYFYEGLFPAIREFVPPKSDMMIYNSKDDCMVRVGFFSSIGFLLPLKGTPNMLWTFLSNVDAIKEVLKMQSKKLKGPFVEIQKGEYDWISINRIC